MAPKLDVKRLELLRETLPAARTVAVISNPRDQGNVLHQRWSKEAADTLKLKLVIVSVSSPDDLNAAYATLKAMRLDAVLMFSDALLVGWGAQISAFTLSAGLPLFGEFSLYASNGGLMSYGASLDDMAQRVASYADRIFKGAKPADLPMERASTFELVSNLKTAQALGITVPQSVRLRADGVIQ